MKQKLLILAMVICFCVCLFTACNNTSDDTAPDGTHPSTEGYADGLAYSVNDDGETCTITGIGTCTQTAFEIPEEIDGYTVTSIGQLAFNSCENLTSVVIPDSVTTIGNGAFRYCTSLTSVTFEDPNGWYATKTEGATSGTSLTLTNATTNATYLKSTYDDYYWYKK